MGFLFILKSLNLFFFWVVLDCSNADSSRITATSSRWFGRGPSNWRLSCTACSSWAEVRLRRRCVLRALCASNAREPERVCERVQGPSPRRERRLLLGFFGGSAFSRRERRSATRHAFLIHVFFSFLSD